MYRRRASLLTMCAIAAGMIASAMPVPSLDLAALCDQADLIVVAHVGTFKKVGTATVVVGGDHVTEASVESADVSILAVLKGAPMSGTIQISVTVAQPPAGSIGLDGISAGSTRVLFLRRLSANTTDYVVSDSYHPSLPAGPSVPGIGSDPLTNVANIECSVMTDGNANESDRVAAIISLRHVKSNCIIPSLRNVGADPSSEDEMYLAQSELLMRNDISLLRLDLDEMTSGPLRTPGYQRDNLLAAISFGVRDVSAVPVLSERISDQSADLRLADVRALKAIGDLSCIAPLNQALSDENQEVRYTAVIGLADILKEPQYHPSVVEFQSNEDKYVSHFMKGAEGQLMRPR